MDYIQNLMVSGYISLHSYLHLERHTSHPCDVLTIALMLQWLELALWSPSLPLVQRYHFNQYFELVSIP